MRTLSAFVKTCSIVLSRWSLLARFCTRRSPRCATACLVVAIRSGARSMCADGAARNLACLVQPCKYASARARKGEGVYVCVRASVRVRARARVRARPCMRACERLHSPVSLHVERALSAPSETATHCVRSRVCVRLRLCACRD